LIPAAGADLRTAATHLPNQEHGMISVATRLALAALTLSAAATAIGAQQPVIVQNIVCRGEEPFWQLDANRTTAVFNRLISKGNREVIFRGAPQSFPDLKPAALVWRGDSTRLPRETLVVALREETCRSTMTDGPTTYWRAFLSQKTGEALTGCCSVLAGYDARLAPVAEFDKKLPDDWARQLPNLLAAVNLCLASDGGRAKWVAKAWPAAGGPAHVRMIETAGKAVDCETDMTGKGVARIDAVSAGDPPLQGAGSPLFYPAREQAPLVSCGKLERVTGRTGTIVGYLHYDPC
jgi:uncharacterized membrane protein